MVTAKSPSYNAPIWKRGPSFIVHCLHWNATPRDNCATHSTDATRYSVASPPNANSQITHIFDGCYVQFFVYSKSVSISRCIPRLCICLEICEGNHSQQMLYRHLLKFAHDHRLRRRLCVFGRLQQRHTTPTRCERARWQTSWHGRNRPTEHLAWILVSCFIEVSLLDLSLARIFHAPLACPPSSPHRFNSSSNQLIEHRAPLNYYYSTELAHAGSARGTCLVPQPPSEPNDTAQSACTVLRRRLVHRYNSSDGDVHAGHARH